VENADITVRPLHRQDLDEIGKWPVPKGERQYFLWHPSGTQRDESWKRWSGSEQRKPYAIVLGDNLIGHVLLKMNPPMAWMDVAIKPGMQRRGYGKSACLKVLPIAKKMALRRISGAPSKSRGGEALLRSLGFRDEGGVWVLDL